MTVGRYFLHHVVKAVNWKLVKSGPQESWASQSGVTEEIVPDIPTEAAVDLACDQDQVLREQFSQTARSHREEILHPDLEEIYEPRHLIQEEDEDDETKTARPLSEREKRELFRQHRHLGHPQPTELARALRHAGARREATRFVLKELRCSSCEARPLPLPPRPGMLPRCLRKNQCIGVDLVDLEVRDGTSAKAKKRGLLAHWAPDCSAIVDKLHREDRERVG